MKQSLCILGLIALALLGCDRAGGPANKVEAQTERKDQQAVAPPATLWSAEFKSQTLNECSQSATREGNADGVRKCQCVVDKASATIPEQRFKTIGTDAEVKEMVRKIGATC